MDYAGAVLGTVIAAAALVWLAVWSSLVIAYAGFACASVTTGFRLAVSVYGLGLTALIAIVSPIWGEADAGTSTLVNAWSQLRR